MFSHILITSRPSQWMKNLIVFIPVLFSMNESWTFQEYNSLTGILIRSIFAFTAFTFITIAIYCINDIFDIENDKKHPIKKNRPIASGDLRISEAIYFSIVCIFISLTISVFINLYLLAAIFVYMILMLSYSWFFKGIIFLDVILISSGFVIRVIAGAMAIEVPISIWICLCMISGALFIAVSKRFSEIKTNKDNFVFQRPVLIKYSFLSKKKSILAFIMFVTIILYSLYSIFATNLPDNHLMLITIPFVIVGMIRYFYLVIESDLGEKPESIVVKDFVMRIVIASWLLLVGSILYFWR